MKRYILFALMALPVIGAQAQDTYLNDRATNTSDVIGTARYVGMGGAMGALGADISAISNNPASIGLMRRGTLSFTLGGQISDAKPMFGDNRGSFTFDQIGFVFPFGDISDETRLNFAFNYQKKINYNQHVYAVQPLNSLSQADLFSWIAGGIERFDNSGNFMGFKNPMYNGLEKTELFSLVEDGLEKNYYCPPSGGLKGNYYRHTWGSLQGFDFNISGSSEDRWYWGLTFGIDHMNYHAEASYNEESEDPLYSYILDQEQKLIGYGFNVKLGTIIRPIEDSPLRFGLAIETPSWYVLKHNSWASISYINDDGNYGDRIALEDYYTLYDRNEDNFNNYLEYNIYSPWKFRASLGSTIEDYFAWDVEYEYSMNNYTKMGYPDNSDYYDYDGSAISMDKDRAMGEMTHKNIKGVHNVRAGFEVKPISKLALRGGYNFYSKPYKDEARLDMTTDSYGLLYSTSTEYINLGATHLFTLGIGYQGKHFFADLAYKYRVQRGDFYAFDDYYTRPYTEQDGAQRYIPLVENNNLQNVHLQPTEVNLDRHNIAVTLGYRF